jgi:hypothetical protein
VIVARILDEGQFTLVDDTRAELETRDARLLAALEADDRDAYTAELAELLTFVRANGSELALDVITPSEFVLPNLDMPLAAVRALLADHPA